MQGNKGKAALLIGLVLSAGLIMAAAPACASSERVLYSFGGSGDGQFPQAALYADSNGNFYGTTVAGGAFGHGVVFKLAPPGCNAAQPNSWCETVLHAFNGSDGAFPGGGALVADSSGNLYGATSQGGMPCFPSDTSGCGVVFQASPSGAYTVLYTFTNHTDGGRPLGALIADSNVNLYGTAVFGGASGNGVVFQVSPPGCDAAHPNSWCETVLHDFGASGDGALPEASLIADKDGNLYGTTANGGAFGNGVVFKLAPPGCNAAQPNSWCETVLHSFKGSSDGALPSSLIRDTNGNLYGTTQGGGAFGNGTAFRLSLNGVYTVLHSFCANPRCTDGRAPLSSLIRDSNGKLYGTTFSGGGSGAGTVFRLSPSGTETVLYSFCRPPSCSDGASPAASLIAGSNGMLYGTTDAGGTFGTGVVFQVQGTDFTALIQP